MWPRLLILPALILFVSSLSAQATAPTQTSFYDNHFQEPLYFYGDNGNCQTACVQFASSIVGGGYVDGTANWKGITLMDLDFGSSSNPQQSFGIGVNAGTVEVNAVASDHIEFIEAYSGSAFPKLFVVSNTTLNSFVYQGGQAVIQQAQYSTALPFNCGAPPCVYYNSANDTYIAQLNSLATQQVDWYYPAFGNGKSCGIPGFSQSCSGGIATSTTTNQAAGQVTTTTTVGGGAGGIFTTTVINGVTTTVPLASATGNPANIPGGILVIFGLLALLFIPALFLRDRRNRPRTYRVDLKEPRGPSFGGSEPKGSRGASGQPRRRSKGGTQPRRKEKEKW